MPNQSQQTDSSQTGQPHKRSYRLVALSDLTRDSNLGGVLGQGTVEDREAAMEFIVHSGNSDYRKGDRW